MRIGWPLRSRGTSMKVPILGVEASGKTTFAWGIGRTLVDRTWGIATDQARVYFNQIDPFMLRNQPLPATLGKQALTFRFDRCSFDSSSPEFEALARLEAASSNRNNAQANDSRWVDISEDFTTCTFRTEVLISTYDLSGGDFTRYMGLFSQPISQPEANPDMRRFMELLRASDGLIVLVDLARRITTRTAFEALTNVQRNDHILQALGEQVSPLCQGVEAVMRVNPKLTGKPVIFAFTKADIHGLPPEWVDRNLKTAYATMVGALRSRGVVIHTCCLSYEGARIGDAGGVEFRVTGVDRLLSKLVVGLLESRASGGNRR